MNSPQIAIPTAAPISPEKAAAPVAQLLALDAVKADGHQPRRSFDDATLKELADSIRADGLVQPIVVKSNGTGYLLIDGERRLRAAKLAGLKEIPALIRGDLKDRDVTALQLVANIQREDLNLADQCDAVAKLVKALGAKAAGEKLGKSESWVSKRAGVAEAPAEIRALVDQGLVVDVEIASGLAQLKQVAPKVTFDKVLLRVKTPDTWRGPITRDDLSDEIKTAKDESKRREKEAREKAAAKSDPKAIADKDKEAKHAQKLKDKKAKVDALNAECQALVDRAMAQLLPVLGFKVPQRGEFGRYDDETPIFIGCETFQFNQWDPDQKLPAGVAGTSFGIQGFGGAEHLERMVKLFHTVKIDNVSLEAGSDYYRIEEPAECIALLKLLKNKKGIGVDFTVHLTHAQLLALVQKHTGKPLAHAAVIPAPDKRTRGQAAAGIQLPGKKAAKPTTKPAPKKAKARK